MRVARLTAAGHRQPEADRSRRSAWPRERVAALPPEERSGNDDAAAVLVRLTEVPR